MASHDYEEFIAALNAHGARYLIVGAHAVAFHARPRATKDLDIVLCLEVLDATFTRAIWDFVRSGGYTARERSSGRPEFFRFSKPKDETYPAMLELFSRKPDMLEVPEGERCVRIPAGDDVSS